MKNTHYTILLLFTMSFQGCWKYSFTGVSDLNADTFQVNYFQNTSALIEPGLDRDFTIALQDLLTNQTSLGLVPSNGDLVYEGEITEYRISPTTATSDNRAAQNRLTITVQVRFFTAIFVEFILAFKKRKISIVPVLDFIQRHSEIISF